jgi:hypothetical protein
VLIAGVATPKVQVPHWLIARQPNDV